MGDNVAEGGGQGEIRDWSRLQSDLLWLIGEKINLCDDRLRSRSVCSSWRSAILPLSKSIPPLLPPRIPHPIDPNSTLNSVRFGGFFRLCRTTVYRLQPLQGHNHGGLWTAWLMKVSETHQWGSLRLLNPLSDIEMNHNHLIDVRVSEVGISVVCDTYALKFEHYKRSPGRPPRVPRTVLFPSVRGEAEMLAVVDDYGHLAVLRIKGLKWILDNTTDRFFDYILDYDGKVYAVDDSGLCVTLDVRLDSLLNLIQVAPPLNLRYRSFAKKYLVESNGDLLLVDEYTNANSYVIDDDIETGEVYSREQDAIFQAPIFFKVYKLDKRECKWVGVRDLGDRVLFVAPDCSYSVSAHDFNGWSCMGNKIFFSDKLSQPNAPNMEYTYNPLRGVKNLEPMVFSLEDGSVRSLISSPGCCDIIWPPPLWLQERQ